MSLWQPLAPKNMADPYPMYEAIRAKAPVYQAQTGELIVTGFDDITQILQNKNQFLAGNGKEWLAKGIRYFKTKDLDLSAIADAMNSFILLLNPPQHQQIRKFVYDSWSDRAVETIIQENCQELIDTLPMGKFDFIETFASRLPAMTISRIMGVSNSDFDYMHQLGERMVKSLDFYLKLEDLVKIDQSAREFIKIFKALVQHPPPSGLIRKIVENNKRLDQPLSENALISICIFLFVAGEETSVSLLSTGVYNLLRYDQWKKVNKMNVSHVIEELLRFDGPVHLLGRIAAHNCKLKGVTINKGDTITLCIAAANRDPRQFEAPDQLKITRKPKHLAFGSGNHYCLGDWLARKQACLAFEKLLSALPDLKLESDTIEWKNQLAIRRMKSLTLSG